MSGGVWTMSYVVLWAAVGVLLVMVLALLRQIGLLHARLDEVGAGGRSASGLATGGSGSVEDLDGADEGPELGADAPMPGRLGYGRAPMTLVAFTAAGCELSAMLAPALRRVDHQYGDAVRVLELSLGPRTIAAFEAFNVEATPFVVAVDRDGRVRARGRARSLAQLEDLVASAGAAALAARSARVDGASATPAGMPRAAAPSGGAPSGGRPTSSSPATAPPAPPGASVPEAAPDRSEPSAVEPVGADLRSPATSDAASGAEPDEDTGVDDETVRDAAGVSA
jgi:hypothetical protein